MSSIAFCTKHNINLCSECSTTNFLPPAKSEECQKQIVNKDTASCKQVVKQESMQKNRNLGKSKQEEMKKLKEKVKKILEVDESQDYIAELTDSLLSLFDETVREVIGTEDFLYAKKDGTLPDEGIKNLVRNELRTEQLDRWEKEKSE